MSWLDPTRWLLYGGLLLALALGAWRLESHIEQKGYDRAQAEYTDRALKASEAARLKEKALNNSNERLANDLAKANRRHADAVAAADDAERVFLAALNSTPSSTDTATATGTYGAGGLERQLLGACAQNLVVGLQDYVKSVCLK
jgi:hypothetical protein